MNKDTFCVIIFISLLVILIILGIILIHNISNTMNLEILLKYWWLKEMSY